jgi:hypothetical protein
MIRLLALFFSFLLLLFGVANAKVIDFSIKPENPVKGDVVTIYGTASPNEEVQIDISFEKVVPVKNGEYVFSVNGIKIPDGKNRFTVTAYGCRGLDVSARRQIIGGLYTPWITLSKEATNGVASISQSVPPGTYDVIIHGKSSQSSVKLKITATGYIKADESGKFSYSYETSSIPPGKFVVSAGGITKVITLAEYSESSSSSASSSSSSGGGGGATQVSTPTLTPTPTQTSQTPTTITTTLTQIETPVMTPTITTLKQTSKPEQTPTPTRTLVRTPTVVGNLTQQVNGTNEVNKNKKTSRSTQIPGFEFIVAIISLVMAVFAYKRLKY